ncbi:MAG: hypothetical protein IPG74_03070 [Flavobacteriales bacterium]|nr:hypothetical protein [Flavobacteriales bacterium]
MSNHRLILILALAGCVPAAWAQTITVLDDGTGTPIEGVTVFSKRPAASVITDVKGHAPLDAMRGADTIWFKHVAHETMWASHATLSATPMVRLTMLTRPLPEFTMSANRWEQEDARVPDHITVIKPRDIAFNNPGTAADVLQQSGEVFVQKSQQGGGSPMLRGFAANRALMRRGRRAHEQRHLPRGQPAEHHQRGCQFH